MPSRKEKKIKHPSAVMKRGNKRCNMKVAVLPSGKEKKPPFCCDEEM
jgi:hypothetical protein